MEIQQAYNVGRIAQGDVEPKTNITAAETILETAKAALANRAEIRDQANGERSAARAAAILSAWTGQDWCESDVWRCQLALKLAREIQGKYHADDYIDTAGYAALLGECQSFA